MSRYMVTYSGQQVYRDKGVPTLEDIAIGLVRTPMFAGSIKEFYTLAHHSIAVAQLMPRHKIYGLLHEAEVCCYGDCPGPLKSSPTSADEYELRRRVYKALEIPDINSDIILLVEEADQLDQAAEARLFEHPEGTEIWSEDKYKPGRLSEAMVIAFNLYREFPPADQLSYHSDLFTHFYAYACTLIEAERRWGGE